ncbi:MAG: transposase, partial [Acinetobacter sp.]
NGVFDVDAAYQRFFEGKGKVGHPKFKKKHTAKRSYTTEQTNNNISVGCGCIKLPKLGYVTATLHRDIPDDCVIKKATVSQSASGKYYCSLLVQCAAVQLPPIPPKKVLGLDYSSPNFYIDSNGNSPTVPHAYRVAESRLAREERRLSSKHKGSKNYNKQHIKLAICQEHVANQRKDFTHQLSTQIANEWDAVCLEDLDLRNLSQCLKLGKATADNGFGMFRTFLQYKLQERGKLLIKIDKWYPSSKTCHHCGYKNDQLALSDRQWVCPVCNNVLDRDKNAALNIRDEGLRTVS